jgi:murein L,D-transpeptidase YcbB/YkuD
MRGWHSSAIGLTLSAALVAGCGAGDLAPQIAAALEQILAGPPLTSAKPVWADVRAFYERRAGEPAWVEGRNTKRAHEARAVLHAAQDHGLDPVSYGESDLAAELEAIDQLKDRAASSEEETELAQRLARLDARVTTALLALGRDVALGRSGPQRIDRRWKPQRTSPDLPASLEEAAVDDFGAWLDGIRPPHPEYAALQRALGQLRGQRDKGGWQTVTVRELKPGQTHPSIGQLRTRLAQAGHLDTGEAPMVYDADLVEAVRSFQHLHGGIEVTGVADRATLAAMNVSIDHRIRQVEMNLDRWRWMPDDFGARHLIVNVPSFRLLAREHGEPVLDIRVVVGTVDNKTPLFSSEMSTVVFSPYWNIPDSIVVGETAPAVARDSNYVARNNIEVFRRSTSGSERVDLSEVDWDDPEELKRLAFRQRPGANNALGHVKFLFPNPYNVYLHDTPADRLFSRPGRAFSHGCVRVEEPEMLARYVLRGDTAWDDERIVKAMRSGTEKHVPLKEKIPVHLVYFTAWVDEKGGLHFAPDIYGYDALQIRTI